MIAPKTIQDCRISLRAELQLQQKQLEEQMSAEIDIQERLVLDIMTHIVESGYTSDEEMDTLERESAELERLYDFRARIARCHAVLDSFHKFLEAEPHERDERDRELQRVLKAVQDIQRRRPPPLADGLQE